jgi:patatin-related protein
MSSQRSYYQPKFLQEIQLGLVVHSGISLAIYTYGICQEFYHAVRGRGIYKLVKALTDADLVVDSISGSSAGGINGILLSYALTNSNDLELVDFNLFANIWHNSGDLWESLCQPNSLRKQSIESDLNNDNVDRYASIYDGDRKIPRPAQEWFSASTELDLAIAGTNYLGKVDRTLNDTGIDISSKNHRTLFLLKHRQGRKEPFNPHYQDPDLPRSPEDTYRALTKLCQITAGTPMVFPLVEVDLHNQQNLVDRQLVIWGKLEQYRSPERNNKLYFLDGGLLDNAPFTCLMKSAYYRLPSRLGQRKLFYVDPNPEHVNDRIYMSKDKKYRNRQNLPANFLSIPIHQSISNDLRTIQEHNHKVHRYQTLINRSAALVETQQLLESGDLAQSQIYLRGRLFDFRDRNLPLLLHADLDTQNTHFSSILDKIELVLTNKITNSQERIHYHKLLNRFECQVIDLDVEYSIRKHFYLIDRITNLLTKIQDFEVQKQLQDLSRQLSCNIKLLETVRSGIELLLKDRSISNYFYYLINQESNDRRLRALVYEIIFRLHRFLLDGTKFRPFTPHHSSESYLETIPAQFWLDLPQLAAESNSDRWLSQTIISSAFAQIKQRITDLHQNNDLHRLIWMDRCLEYDNDSNLSFPSILKQIALAAEVSIEKFANRYTAELLKQWHTFDSIDRNLYPFEYLTSLSEKKLINPICISPDRAQLGMGNGKSFQEKLGSNKLYNIGGVFKKSWRSNDLLWGRIDGLSRIIEGVVTPQSVTAFANFVRREAARHNYSKEQYLDWLITESLPNLSGIERHKISEHLTHLSRSGLRIDRVELRQILADLILVGQREILTNNVHSSIEGVDQQSDWWQLPQDPRSSPKQLISNQAFLAPISNPRIITRIIYQSLTNLATQQDYFFHHQYRISIDRLWNNVPLATLISFSTKVVLILRNLLIKVFGIAERTQPIRYSLYHLLDCSLQSIYWWLQSGTIEFGNIHRQPRIFFFQFLGVITSIGSIVLACLLLSPLWLLFFLPSIISCWFLQTMRLRRLTGRKHNPFLTQSNEL